MLKCFTLCDHLIYLKYKKFQMKYTAHRFRNEHEYSPVCFDQTEFDFQFAIKDVSQSFNQ